MVKVSMPNIEKSTMLLTDQDSSRPLNSIDDTIMLFDVRNIILRYNISIVGISKNGNIIGIITVKDILKFLYVYAPGRKRLIEISVKELIQNRMD